MKGVYKTGEDWTEQCVVDTRGGTHSIRWGWWGQTKTVFHLELEGGEEAAW